VNGILQYPSTNSQLRTSSNPRNQATIQDGSVIEYGKFFCKPIKGDRVDSGPNTQTLPTTAIFQTDDIDAFNSDCDEAPSTSAVLMAKLSAYDSDVLPEVPNYATYQDANVIDQKNKSEVVQDTTSSEQQDAMIMSVIEEMSNQVAKCNAVNQENKTVNESLTAELERYKEVVKILKETDRNFKFK
ncbi:hypothetical protein Tco_0756342, partial [Tanacetum coccineum]